MEEENVIRSVPVQEKQMSKGAVDGQKRREERNEEEDGVREQRKTRRKG